MLSGNGNAVRCNYPSSQLRMTKLAALTIVVLMVRASQLWLIESTVLNKFVDVKGNNAIRETRILYDLYDQDRPTTTLTTTESPTKMSNVRSSLGGSPYQWSAPVINTNSYSLEKNSAIPPTPPNQIQHQTNVHSGLVANLPSGTVSSHVRHPQYYLEQNLGRPPTQSQLAHNRFAMQNVRAHQLIRGRPLFAEIDFVPRYIPAATFSVAVSVTLPAHIRGRPWILGWHQEIFPMPACRLCTNREQSFTLPVTLFLPDDGWCAEGRVPTIWKVEAFPRENNGRFTDQTDMNLAYGYDELRQLHIFNDVNGTSHCRGISEAIVA